MKTIKALLSLLLTVSCVKEPLSESPYQYSVLVYVRDKNYFNSGELGADIAGENLPFRQYVSNLYYRLQNTATGANAIEPELIRVTGNEKEVELILDNLPDGEYRLTVWGNVTAPAGTVSDPRQLHDNKEEGSDTYLASATLTLERGKAKTASLGLRRTKGKLSVTFENLPDEIVRIEETIAPVYGYIDERGNYSQETQVEKTRTKDTASLEMLSTRVAPSTGKMGSSLSLIFYAADNDEALMTIPPIDIAIDCNRITAVAINLKPEQTIVEIWIYTDNQWTLVNKLNVDFSSFNN